MNIPRFSDMNIGQRTALTFIIVLIILFALALYGYLTGAWDKADAQTPYLNLPSSKWDDRLAELDKQALDEAYKSRIHHLFEVWMKDETGQPSRASVGLQQARRAYI